MPDHVNPMVPFLSGWLCGTVEAKGKDCMKILTVRPAPDGFEVAFASGLVLRVRVEEAAGPPGGTDDA